MEQTNGMMAAIRKTKMLFPLLALSMAFFSASSCGGGGSSGLPAPTGVQGTSDIQSVMVSWDNVPAATSYNIYYSKTSPVTKTTGSRILSASNPRIVSGLDNGVRYYFVVTSVNGEGESGESSQIDATPLPPPPGAPANVVATAGYGEVEVGWDAVAGAVSYNIYYDTTSTVTKQTTNKVTGITTRPYTVTGLTNNVTHYFRVASVNAGGEGELSGLASAMPVPEPVPPVAPTGVSAAAGASGASIDWIPAADADSYVIYYSTTSPVTKTSGTRIGNIMSRPSYVSGLTPGTTYYFAVSGVNSDGEGPISTQVSARAYMEYVAFGDSITNGEGDDIASDDTSNDGLNSGGGFEPILNNLLTSAKGYSHSIVNEGYGGYTAQQGYSIIPTVLANHPNATCYLIMFGTNDAYPAVSKSVYKSYMQSIINAVTGAGKTAYLAKVPYSTDGSIDAMIQQYNQAIDELVAENGISVVPPNFYSHFQAHPDQLADDLHPNGTGYQSMAQMWKDALP